MIEQKLTKMLRPAEWTFFEITAHLACVVNCFNNELMPDSKHGV